MFKYITGNVVYPVRLSATSTLLHYLKNMKRADYREEMCSRIISDCQCCSSYKGRMMFLDVVDMILEQFSRNFFKINFFKSVLLLSNDKVINIRMRFYRMLPSLKRCLKLPSDRLLLKELESCVRLAISSEVDPESSNCLRESVAELDQVNVTLEVYSRQTYFEDEIIDHQKEEEEKQLWGEEGVLSAVSKQHLNGSIKRSMSSDDRLKSASLPRVCPDKGGKAPLSKMGQGKKQMYSPQIGKKSSCHSSSSTGSGFATPPSSLKLSGDTNKSGSVSHLSKKTMTPSVSVGLAISSGEGSADSTPNHSPVTGRTTSLQNLTSSQKSHKVKSPSPLGPRRNTSPTMVRASKGTTSKLAKTPSKDIVSPSGSGAKKKVPIQKQKRL
jgi:hypothetical protein